MSVTVGIVARERFSAARRCLRSLYANTRVPFRLIIVDGNMPPRYRREMREIIDGRPDVEVIQKDRYLLTNEAKNLIIKRTTTEFLALLENDTMVGEGWLTHLVAACEELSTDVATPIIFEGRRWPGKPHFDCRIADLRRTLDENGKQTYEFIPREEKLAEDLIGSRKRVQGVETHCLLFRRSLFDRIGLLDERIRTRKEVDLMLTMFQHGVWAALEPRAKVLYAPPPPVRSDERPFYLLTWDPEGARQSQEYIQQKWNVKHLPSTLGFAHARLLRTTYPGYLRLIMRRRFRELARALKRQPTFKSEGQNITSSQVLSGE